MTGIPAYKFRPAAVVAKYSKSNGGFKAKTKELVPMSGPGGEFAYFSPSWTAFQADRGRDFSVIVDGVSS